MQKIDQAYWSEWLSTSAKKGGMNEQRRCNGRLSNESEVLTATGIRICHCRYWALCSPRITTYRKMVHFLIKRSFTAARQFMHSNLMPNNCDISQYMKYKYVLLLCAYVRLFVCARLRRGTAYVQICRFRHSVSTLPVRTTADTYNAIWRDKKQQKCVYNNTLCFHQSTSWHASRSRREAWCWLPAR